MLESLLASPLGNGLKLLMAFIGSSLPDRLLLSSLAAPLSVACMLPEGLLPEGLLPEGLLPEGLLPEGVPVTSFAGGASATVFLPGFPSGFSICTAAGWTVLPVLCHQLLLIATVTPAAITVMNNRASSLVLIVVSLLVLTVVDAVVVGKIIDVHKERHDWFAQGELLASLPGLRASQLRVVIRSGKDDLGDSYNALIAL